MDNEKEKYKSALETGEECLKALEDSTIKSLKFTVEDVRDTILCIFPELKESEDDRIRKAIIKCLKWLRDEARWTDIYDTSFNSIFAWLEKQSKKDEEISFLKNKIEAIQYSVKVTENVVKTADYDKGFRDGVSASRFNRWKPSKKQMEAFEKGIKTIANNFLNWDTSEMTHIQTLYNDLCKLKR